MRWIIVALSLISAAAQATPSYWQGLNNGELLAPRRMIAQVEQQFPGVVTQFSISTQQQQVQYDIQLIEPITKTCHLLLLNAHDGALLQQQDQSLDSHNELLHLVQHLQQQQVQFSQLLNQALAHKQGKLVSAKLDRGLGISYIELKLLNADGSERLAYDIDHRRQLPLLKWD
ncbi:hypothetical protein L9G15_10715 [Shewanella sp. A3A]|nr:hypothetical protein [Shewanella ferrihydritica]